MELCQSYLSVPSPVFFQAVKQLACIMVSVSDITREVDCSSHTTHPSASLLPGQVSSTGPLLIFKSKGPIVNTQILQSMESMLQGLRSIVTAYNQL